MEESRHQYRIVCPVMGNMIDMLGDERIILDRADAEEWAIGYAFEHRHAPCKGKGHMIESRFVGPWGPVDRPVRSLTVMEGL